MRPPAAASSPPAWLSFQNSDEDIATTTPSERLCRSVPRVSNPQGRYPDELPIVLLTPDVIVTGLASLGLVVTPGEVYLLSVRRSRVNVLAITHDADLGEFGGA